MRPAADSPSLSPSFDRAPHDVPDDVRFAIARGANILLVGHPGQVEHVLDSMLTLLREPITTWHRGCPLVLPPATGRGTLLLRHVDALQWIEQRRLELWSEPPRPSTQIISTTTRPLHSLVLAGGFAERLYYHLNTVCIEIEPPQPR